MTMNKLLEFIGTRLAVKIGPETNKSLETQKQEMYVN